MHLWVIRLYIVDLIYGGGVYLNMHHAMVPSLGQSCGIVPVLQFFLYSGALTYVRICRVNRRVKYNPKI